MKNGLIGVICTVLCVQIIKENFQPLYGTPEWTVVILMGILYAVGLTLAIIHFINVLEEVNEMDRIMEAKTMEEWKKEADGEFSDPEIEDMWNRAYYFVSRGMEPPTPR